MGDGVVTLIQTFGASALYRSGVPARVVRYLTGHTTDKQLFKYIKIDKEEGLELLARSAA